MTNQTFPSLIASSSGVLMAYLARTEGLSCLSLGTGSITVAQLGFGRQ